MADAPGEHTTGLEDVFDDDTAATAAPTGPAEIQMPAEWVGRGNPPRPDHVRDDIASKQQQAESLRQRSATLTAQEQRLDGDVNVANQLLAVRTEEHQQLQDRADALTARASELVDDAARHDPDIHTASQDVITIKRQLGEKMPSDTDLMRPDGSPPAAPVTPETDPTRIAALRDQLITAEAKLDQVVAERAGSDPELARIKAEQATLKPQLDAATSALHLQQSSTTDLKARAESLEADSVKSLDQARGLEAEAKNLTDALPDYQQIYDTWSAEHPDEAKVTDLGTIDVKSPPRDTAARYAQGRREEAGRLEQQASDTDKAAADAGNGAEARLELAQRNEQSAAELTQRAEADAAHATTVQAQATAAAQQAEHLVAESDRMKSEAAQLRTQGRTDAADTMDARATSMNDDAIKAQFRSGDLDNQSKALTASAATAQSQAADLTTQSASLRTEATTLTTEQTTLQQQAVKFREDATTRDHIAQQVEDQLQTGQAFHFQLVDDRMGESIDLDVPAGPPPYATDPAGTAADPTASATDAALDDSSASATATATSDADVGADPLVADDDITGASAAATATPATDDDVDATAAAGADPAGTEATGSDATASGVAFGGDDVGDSAPASAFDDPGTSDFAVPDDAAIPATDPGGDDSFEG